MFLKSIVVAALCSVAMSAPIELCEIPKEWGAHSYPMTDNCSIKDLKLLANKFTIGGSSHGSYMAANLFTMFNDNIDGASFNIGSGPCANAAIGEQNIGHIFTCKRHNKTYSTAGIKGKPVHIYAGVNDTIIPLDLPKQTADYFEEFGANVKRLWIHDFGHMFPNNVQSNNFFNPPASCAPVRPFDSGVPQCGYNMAHEIFTHLYGDDLQKDDQYQDSGKLYTIDQKSFSSEESYLAEQGYLYVPNACLNESCRFHMEFHGANSTLIFWNDTMMRRIGEMEFAAASKIIIYFPNSDDEFWGHGWRSGFDQDSANPQIVAISNVVKALFDKDLMNEGVDTSTANGTGLFSMMRNFGQGYLNHQFMKPLTSYNQEMTQIFDFYQRKEQDKNNFLLI